MKSILLLSLSFLAMFVSSLGAQEKLLKESEKILVLGDSITQNGKYVTFFAEWLAKKYPDKKFTVINAGVASETISGLSEKNHAGGRFPRPSVFERLERVLAKTNPDLIISCYGINCGIYLPLDEARFEKFKNGNLRLRAAAKQYNAQVVHVTPPFFDNHGKKGFNYNDVLSAYAKWLVKQREQGWYVADLHSEMQKTVMDERKKNPDFTVQKDRVHPNTQGHWMMAQSLIRYFGDAKSAELANAGLLLNDAKKSKAVAEKMRVYQRAIHAETKPLRPGVPQGGTLKEAEKMALELDKVIYPN